MDPVVMIGSAELNIVIKNAKYSIKTFISEEPEILPSDSQDQRTEMISVG